MVEPATAGVVILRSWHARAASDDAHHYEAHFADAVLPRLQAIPGFLGAQLLRRRDVDGVEFAVQTIWESMTAVEGFAGSSPDVAVVDPEARAVLVGYDEQVKHFDVVMAVGARGRDVDA